MKKTLFLALLLGFALTSCGELNKNSGENVDNPFLDDEPTEELQPDEQKTKLESVANKLMQECSHSDWNDLSKLAEDFSKKFCTEDYDFDAFYEWYDVEFGKAFKEEDSETISNGKKYSSYYIEVLILLSNHKGLFTFGDKGVTVTDYDGTKAAFSLNGKNYEATIRQEGKITEAVYVYTYKGQWNESGYIDENGNWVEGDIEINADEKYKVTVGVPERLEVIITENGSEYAAATIGFTPSLTAGNVNPATDSFSSEISVRMNGYEYTVENITYDGASGKGSFSRTISKNGKTLLSSVASGDIRFETKKEKDGNYEYTIIEASLAKNITATVDILGEIQVVASCSNANDAIESSDKFWQAARSDDENTARRHLDNLNAKFDTGVFYDKGNNKQAQIIFDFTREVYDAEWDSNGDGLINSLDTYIEYYLMPIIVFNDGSKYAIDEYFTEEAFGELITSFEEFCSNYAGLFGFIEE